MKRFTILVTLLVLMLPGCGGEPETGSEGAASAPASPAGDVGTAGSDATAAPVAGDSSATAGSHP
jgi:hypothetical protein